jgi:hypothetical protein
MAIFGIVVPGNAYPVLTIGANSKATAEMLYRKHCRGSVLPAAWTCLPYEEALTVSTRLYVESFQTKGTRG